jgi:hypothetical protein
MLWAACRQGRSDRQFTIVVGTRDAPNGFGVVCCGADQTSGCAQNSPLWRAAATVAISGNNVPYGASVPVLARLRAK